ncbi:MAG: Bcr/CflA family efflux MFS transporter [Chthoniobacterales bacterium]|nr:Bcr/CflA family efflux MFS transporter [Chthoniobacterales bacterium]
MNNPPAAFPAVALAEKKINLILCTLLPLSSLTGMAVDLVAPSLPLIASDLHISSGITKNVITLYLLGYALGNFCSGFLTDAWGRKHILRAGLLGFIVASLLPVVVPTIIAILVARFFEGITIGMIVVVARAIYSDILPPQKLVRMGTLMGSMFGIGTVIGPLIGGYLQFYGGWKACFLFFIAVALVAFVAVLFILPETHFRRHSLRLKTIHHHLAEVLHHREFMALVLIMGAIYSLMIAFNTAGPFLIQTKMHHTPIFFGNTGLCLGAAFLGATFFCRYCIKKYRVDQLLFFVIHLFFLIALIAWIGSFFFFQSIILLLGVSIAMFFSTGFIFPMCMGKGMELFRHITGTATAMMYLINILMTSLTSFLLSFLNIQSTSSMIVIYLLLLAICVFIYWKFILLSSFSSTHAV